MDLDKTLKRVYVLGRMFIKFREKQQVRLVHSRSRVGLRNGQVGTVLMVYTEPDEGYEVEFRTRDGKPKAVCTLSPDDLEPAAEPLA